MSAPDKRTSVGMISAAFGSKLSDETYSVWIALLSPYDDESVYRAAVALIRKTTDAAWGRMPLFGLMQRELDSLSAAIHGEENVELQAEAEWGRFLDAIASCGYYREPDFERTTAQVIRLLGGWQSVCGWTKDDMPFRHRDFVRLWAQVHDREEAIELGAEGVRALNGTRGIEAVKRMAIGAEGVE